MRGAGQSGKDTGDLLAWNNHSLSTLHDSYGQKIVSSVAQSHLGYIQASERKLAAELRTVQSTFSAAQQVSVSRALSANPVLCLAQ